MSRYFGYECSAPRVVPGGLECYLAVCRWTARYGDSPSALYKYIQHVRDAHSGRVWNPGELKIIMRLGAEAKITPTLTK